MEQTKTANDNKTVSTKLDSATQSQLEAKAALLGVSVAEYLRNIAKDALAENVPVAPVVSNSNSPEAVAPAPALSENDLTAIVTAVSNVLEAALPAVAPTDKATVIISADREHLRKLAGKSLETDYILSTEEEKYVGDLVDAAKANALQELLLVHNCVPMPSDLMSPLQKDMVQSLYKGINPELVKKITGHKTDRRCLKLEKNLLVRNCQRLQAYYKKLFGLHLLKMLQGFTTTAYLRLLMALNTKNLKQFLNFKNTPLMFLQLGEQSQRTPPYVSTLRGLFLSF